MMASRVCPEVRISLRYSRCFGRQRAGCGAGEQLGEADDIGERRAQLVGYMADEGGLDPVRRFERLVAVDQRALDMFGVGHIAIGEERAAIRERQRGAGDDAAVRPVELAFIGAPLGKNRGDRRLGAFPFLRLVIKRAAGADDGVDMRLAVELPWAQAPNRGEGAVIELQTSVRREHRHAFAQGVERLALHMDEGIVAALQRQPLGDVLVEIGDAAFRRAIGDDMQRTPVGQVPLILPLGIGAIGRQPGTLPFLIVGLFG